MPSLKSFGMHAGYSIPRDRILTNAYALILGVALFMWPVVLGFRGLEERLLWITIALIAVFASVWMLSRAMKNSASVELTREKFPWIPLLLFLTALSVPLTWMPLTFFSDEAAMALPALTLIEKVSTIITWPGLILLSIALAMSFFFACRSLQTPHVLGIVFILALFAAAIGIFIPSASTLVMRYPPLVHIMQSITIVLTDGHLDTLRLPNLVWTILLALSLWYLTPSFQPVARVFAFTTLFLTPFGWTYHLLLYQACGEITLGMTASLLLSRILTEKNEKEREALSAWLGMLFSLWILYRPTSIAIFSVTVLLLLVMKQRRNAFNTLGIAAPIALLSLGTYFLGSYQYAFLSTSSSLPTLSSVIHNLFTAVKVFPSQFHLAALAVLLGGSFLVLKRGTPHLRSALLAAWLIALTNISFHQAILPPIWAGFARYSTLLLLPLGVTLAALASQEVIPRNGFRKTLLGLTVFLFLSITPFAFIAFTQSIRTRSPNDIRQSVTGGDLPTALPGIAQRMLVKKDLIILTPDGAFLDLFIAKGFLTPGERNALLKRSNEWMPESLLRPVIIQSPGKNMTFAPNVSKEDEERLREAEVWARKQPGVQEETFGRMVTLIVP